MPEMHQTGAAGERMDSLGELMGFPRPLAAMGGLLLRRGREEEGPTSNGDGRKRRKERGGGKGGEGNFPQSQGEYK